MVDTGHGVFDTSLVTSWAKPFDNGKKNKKKKNTIDCGLL